MTTDFTAAGQSIEASALAGARRSLLDVRGGLYVHDAQHQRVSLAENSPAFPLLSALSECGELTCACCRARDPRARSFFRRGVIRQFTHQVLAGGARHVAVRYVSLGAGLLLTDAEILSGLIEDAGARVESVHLVDCEALYTTTEAHEALRQLAAFVAPATVVAHTSVDSLVRSANDVNGGGGGDSSGDGGGGDGNGSIVGSEGQAPEWFTGRAQAQALANLVVACDAGTDVSRALKRTASTVLCEGGIALTLMNGGPNGVTMRGWKRLAGATPSLEDVPPWPHPQEDAAFHLEEIDLRRGGGAAAPGAPP